MQPYRIFLVEDNPADVFLLKEALRAHSVKCELQISIDGEEARELIRQTSSEEAPDLFVIDLNLPKLNGFEVVEFIRQHPWCAAVPVAVVTTSDSPRDRERAISLGVERYVQKPVPYEEFLKIGGILKSMLPARQEPLTAVL
jgi:two-component system, chemotaxis family, response regulator Rcp1